MSRKISATFLPGYSCWVWISSCASLVAEQDGKVVAALIAVETDRNSIGVEIDPVYLKMAKRKLAGCCSVRRMFEFSRFPGLFRRWKKSGSGKWEWLRLDSWAL
jgi:hypothetical protein